MKFQNTIFAGSYGKKSQFPEPEHMEVAFVGRSNVGKSSLINKLVGRKSLARVSAVPGKTATVNFYLSDETLCLVDLPGYGYAKTSKSEQQRLKKLISDYLSADRDLQLVLQLLDMRHSPSSDDLAMINLLIDAEIPFVIIFTKADKLNKTERQTRMAAFAQELPCFEEIHKIAFSIKTSEGVADLQELLAEIAG